MQDSYSNKVSANKSNANEAEVVASPVDAIGAGDFVEYVAEISRQMANLADQQRMTMLAYLLDMVRIEAEALASEIAIDRSSHDVA